MAMNIASDDNDDVISAINTTPLVDVMLVLLIIFLITIPVVTHTVQVDLPKQRVQALQSQPKSIEIAVNRQGDIFWGTEHMGLPVLVERLKAISTQEPQPDVHVRGDEATPYEFIGKVVTACERAGVAKVAFITEPPARAGS